MNVTQVFFEYLDAELDEILRARLATMLLGLARGPWSNVMDEYLTVRGLDRSKVAKLIVTDSQVGDLIKKSSFSKDEVIDLIDKGVLLKGIRIDLLRTPINPMLIDSLERDAYFAGVEYAQVEYRRLFNETRIAKNKVAFYRGSLFTLESYLSAGATMFEAVYYHKTVRAGELLQLRILDEAGTHVLPSPETETEAFLECDDLTITDILLTVPSDAPQEFQTAGELFADLRRRYLPKMASLRAISDADFLNKISTPDGMFAVEKEIAEDAEIDPSNVYIDFPDRPSVSYYPGKLPLDDIVLFERGTKGYEFWPLTEMSEIARSFTRRLKPVRVYTTRGYRAKVKKVADNLLESVDYPGST
jgi:HD superfamily phosphohydrolase